MKIKIENANKIAVSIFLCYSFTVGLHKYYLGNGNLDFVILTLAVFFTIIGLAIRSNLNVHKQLCLLLFAITLVFVFYNNQNIEKYGIFRAKYELVYVLIVLLFIVLCQTHEWGNQFVEVSSLATKIHCLATIILYFLPSFYAGAIAPLFGSMQRSLMNQYNLGCMPGITPHYSTNAMYLAIGAGVALANYICLKNKKNKNLICLLLMLIALLLTGKRAHILFGAVIFVIVFYITSPKKPGRLFKTICFALAGIFVFYIAIQFIPALGVVVSRFSDGMEGSDITNGRAMQVALAMEYFNKNKLLGIGWDGFLHSYVNPSGVALNVHCVYAQLLCETGVIGFTTFVLFFIYEIVKAIRLLSYYADRQENNEEYRNVYVAVFVELFFLLYCITGNPLYDIQLFFPYMFSCAIVEAYMLKEKRYE